ncbi:hypothetical protein H5T56_05895, partial [Candidatus Bipolaricaulota bacterium]|nr:hypothetical protein [Candidatus Bipolaricaulota bacterium]
MAALFLSGTGGDLTCAVDREKETGLPYVCERFPGAFEHRYAGVQGSIYVLPAETFLEGQTGWEEEVVSPVAVAPIDEILVDDAAAYIRSLQDQGRLRIYFYPSRPPEIPEDDEDLVMRGIVWTRAFGERVLEEFIRYHPHLIDRIKRGLAEGRYRDLSPGLA